jgi:plastocyanin
VRPPRIRLPALAAAGALLLVAGPGAAATDGPSRVQARAYDTSGYSITLSREKLPPGDAIVQFVNNGEDQHDLNVKRVGGTHVVATDKVSSGGIVDLDAHLRRRSTYVLYCSLSDHRALGMVAHLKVGRPQ